MMDCIMHWICGLCSLIQEANVSIITCKKIGLSGPVKIRADDLLQIRTIGTN